MQGGKKPLGRHLSKWDCPEFPLLKRKEKKRKKRSHTKVKNDPLYIGGFKNFQY